MATVAADVSSWRSTDGRWFIDYAENGWGVWEVELSGYGEDTDTPVPADYDGDGIDDLSVKTPSGEWRID